MNNRSDKSEKWSARLTYGAIWSLFRVMSWFPLRMLYVVADMVAWLARDVVGYRRKVVDDNIARSFPEMPESRRCDISRRFYHFLADYFVETVKLASMSERQMRRRVTVRGIEPVNEALRAGRNVSVMLGHYCNWEWVSSLPLHLDLSAGAYAGQIYHPLENAGSDRAFYRLRTRFGARNIAMAESLKRLVEWRRGGHASVVGYISDQAPTWESIHLFLDFLGQDTPVFTGAERLSKMFGAQVYYIDIRRPRRGYYELEFVRITDDASKEELHYVTRRYFSMLEQTIRRAPEYWLWSHRRWKRTRAGFESRMSDVKARLSRT